eukprot:CAMPEP_0194388316 /NCGR_PEP_ID=MMETSP0174-20130528/97851_1 /TAXON_ID=216777 /ORGANISM="Proboscia alata, Strain PI-D3" /LENGTH=33 /DNA_ID= /DNA_START= /DNA_END= /DNA_ORIENTATION=
MTVPNEKPSWLPSSDGSGQIAYRYLEGSSPGVL